MKTTIPPDLDDRFQEPKGWRWHAFKHQDRTLRFGSVSPQDGIPDAIVVCLQGVREFSEKYFETARWCIEHNMSFWIMDWAGQGKSSRFLENPQKRHSLGFDKDIADLHYFILEYIKHSSVHPDRGRIPLCMLAHSMGANLGLRFLHQYPDMIECAAFSAPMIGLKAFEKIPQRLALLASATCNLLAGKSYVPTGGDWKNVQPAQDRLLSGDTQRSRVHNQWGAANESLRCGDVTFGWVYEAQKSCLAVQHKDFAPSIKTPCLFGIPEQEHLVDNTIARRVIARIPNAKSLDFNTSHHEILMESDDIRTSFLDAFYALVKETIIDRPETLKPF